MLTNPTGTTTAGGPYLTAVPIPGGDVGSLLGGVRTYAAVAHELGSIASRLQASVGDVVGSDWIGLGSNRFDAKAKLLVEQLKAARSALEQASGALSTYASMLDSAKQTAHAAQVAVDAANAAASAMLVAQGAAESSASAAADAVRIATQAAGAAIGVPGSLAAATHATQAQAASDQADAAHRQARADLAEASARYDSGRARALALQAESVHLAEAAAVRAAAAFDAVSAQAPAVRAAVGAARSRAETVTRRAHEGNVGRGVLSIFGAGLAGTADVGLAVVDGFQGGADLATDAATVEVGLKAAQAAEEGIADLSGSTATPAEILTAENSAAAGVNVDGQHLDTAINKDVFDLNKPSAEKSPDGKSSTSEEDPPPPDPFQAKFKHAEDFGVIEPRGRAGFDAFEKAINRFLEDPSTIHVDGSYRGEPAKLSYNPTTRQVVIQTLEDKFISGWRMGPEQLDNVLKRASLKSWETNASASGNAI